jgi:hypothetical protein
VFSPGQGPRMSCGPGFLYGWLASFTSFTDVSEGGPGAGDAPGNGPAFRMNKSNSSGFRLASEVYAGKAFAPKARDNKATTR